MNKVSQNIYLTPERESRLDLLLHLLVNGQKPVLLRGPVGAGKRFFLEQFSIRLADANLLAELNAEDVFEGRDDLMQLLGLRLDGLDGSLLGALLTLAARGERLVLLVHDAHQMPESQIGELMALAEAYGSLFLVLSTAENLAKFERLCQVINLEPFTQKQTIEYARQLLSRDNEGNTEVLPLDELVLFIETGGVPGRIHDAVSKHVIDSPAPPSQFGESKKATPIRAWLYGIPLLAALIAVALYVVVFDDPEPVVEKPGIQKNAAIEPPPLVPSPQPIESEHKPLVDGRVVKEKAGPPIAPVIAPSSTAEAGVSAQQQAKISDIASPAKSPVTAELLQADQSGPKGDVRQEAGVTPIKPATEKASPEPVKQDKAKKGPIDLKGVAQKDEKIDPVVNQGAILERSKVATKVEGVSTPQLQSDREWIKSMPGEHYTLQIMGLGKQSSAEAYVEKFPKSEGLYLYRSKRNQGDWYAILYGAYPTRMAAINALPAVRKQFPGVQPWPRRFAAVQQDLF